MSARLRRIVLAAAMLACYAGTATAQFGRSNFEHDYLRPLRQASCPTGTVRTFGDAATLTAKPVPLQGINPMRKTLGELTFVGGFHLTSPDKRFGGLSGIDILEDGNLLTISDTGDFVWIDLAEDGITPTGARIASMRNAAGAPFGSKAEGDAEGLAYNDGLALVSFEGDHRVLAYDIGACGAAARGAPIVFGAFGSELPAAFARQDLKVGGNTGTEGLAISPDWILFAGLESQAAGASPLSARAIEAAPEFDLTIGRGEPPVVGLDVIPGGQEGNGLRLFSLHRSTSALASNVITLLETPFTREFDQAGVPAHRMSEIDERARLRFTPGPSRVLAQMNVLVTIDNFEGVAARELPDGRVRLYVIADDNFSRRQRTLLMIYDVPSRS